MGLSEIVASIDREIAVLRQAREMLSQGTAETPRPARGRRAQTAAKTASAARGGKRRLSPEGRRRIAEAVKRRWEKQRKAAAGKKEAGSK